MKIQKVRTSRIFSLQQKREILSEHLDIGTSLSVVARKNGIHPVTLHNWKRKLKENEQNNALNIHELFDEIKTLKKENKKIKAALVEETLDKKDALDIVDVLKKKSMEQQLSSVLKSKAKKNNDFKII